ncbi:MAG: asparagine synthase-related protein, partial [Acidobacteriota bacterium]
MCGIAGIVRFDRPATASAAELRGLADRLAHRGPDGEGEAYASHAALAHRRLALLDAANGQQPWICPDRRFFLVYNGELRHPAGLHRSLADRWRFTSRCDTEVVLAAWRAWGPSCLERLDGMFAFFLWDDQEQVGWAVRDRLGIKPLVLLQGESTFAFASEAKALVPLLPQRPRANEWAVTEYLTAPCFSGVERPMFDGLSYLAPGQLLRIDRGGLEARRWWRYRLDPRPAEEGAQATAIRRRLQDAVHHALEADEALGIFLSGGLDSTLLAAMAVRAGHRLPAFTVRFAGQAEFDYATSRIVLADDSPFAGQAADAFGLQQTWVDVDRHRLGSTLRRLAIQNCALPAWEQEVAQDALARAARPQVKAVLVGDAADETHWGYHFLLDPTVTRGPAEILRRFAPAAAFSTGDAITRLDRHYRRLVAEDGWSWDDPRQRRLATASLIVHRWLPRLLHNGDVHTM